MYLVLQTTKLNAVQAAQGSSRWSQISQQCSCHSLIFISFSGFPKKPVVAPRSPSVLFVEA